MRGFVYVMSCEGWAPKHLYKIGMSTDPYARAGSITAPKQVFIEDVFPVSDMREAERNAHRCLRRFHHDYEFFKCKSQDHVLREVRRATACWRIPEMEEVEA